MVTKWMVITQGVPVLNMVYKASDYITFKLEIGHNCT